MCILYLAFEQLCVALSAVEVARDAGGALVLPRDAQCGLQLGLGVGAGARDYRGEVVDDDHSQALIH